jgi:energy-converting hydrogenase Eha subunit F
MRLSRRLTGVLLALVLAGVLAPTAFAGKRNNPAPAPQTQVTQPAPTIAAPGLGASMMDIEALR